MSLAKRFAREMLLCSILCLDWCYGVNVMKSMNVKIDFCIACNKRHSAPWFRGPKGSRVCSKMYQKLARQARNAKKVLKKPKRAPKSMSETPPMTASLAHALKTVPRNLFTAPWKRLLDHVDQTDHTGARIVNAIGRADVQAMRVARKMMLKKGGAFSKSKDQIYLLAFCFLLYWSWPVISFTTGVISSGRDILCQDNMRVNVDAVIAVYKGFYVRNGMLVDTPPGLRVVGRDKDRGWSKKRLSALMDQLQNWYKCAGELSTLICNQKTFRASDGMASIKSHELDAFPGDKKDYASLGLRQS